MTTIVILVMGAVFICHNIEKSIFHNHFKNFSPELIMIFLSLPGLAWANFLGIITKHIEESVEYSFKVD